MPDLPVVAVGGRFERFLANRGTAPVTDLLDALRRNGADPGAVIVGQGLSAAQLAELRQLAGDRVPGHAAQRLTHKHHTGNIMISEPVRTASGSYVADLLVDQANEALADHITGQHVPAIALMEAARQTWTAVTERYLLDRTGLRFVVDSLASTFHRFVFPLPATLRYRLVGRQSTPTAEIFRCAVTVFQCGERTTEFDASYRVIEARLCDKHESMAARQAIAAARARVTELEVGNP